MSGRSSASRTKRADKDNGSSDTRDGSKTSKSDLRVDSQGYGKSKGDRSPSVRGGRGGRDRDDRGPRRERNDKPHGRNSRYDSRNDPESGDSWQDDRSYRKHDSKAFVDDSRLSKLVKKISREDDRDRRMTAAKQLKEFLLQPENAKTVVKASDNLLMALQDVFYERTYKDIKLEMAQCLGLVGYAMGRDAQRYVDWLFANLQAPQDDVKILLLTALLETLKHDAVSQKLLDILPTIMSKCQNILETADVPNLLIAVVEIVTYITKDHPHIFASHFTDTVDILVGWHIDSTQKEDLTTFTANALISFKQFWVADMNFSITLLGQFLEDMEAYAEDLCLGLKSETVDEDMPNTDECIIKIHALLRVFTTVMRCMGEYFMPNTSPAVTLEFMIEIVERIIHCIKEVLKVMYCEKVYMAANKCLHLLCTNLGSDYVHDICDGLTGFVVEESLNTRISGSQYLVSFLQLTKKMIEQLSTKLPMKVLSQLLGADSLLHKLRMTQNNLVLKELMSVYHTILGVKSVPLMEEAYRYLLSDLDIAFNTLLEKLESDTHCSLVMANPLSGLVYTPKQAEAAIVFNICALAEVGNTKNNIIGMWALSPSIFNLFANHILPLYPPLMIQYPAIHFAVLQALYSHCSRHGHFISSSYLITQNTTLEGTLLANVNSTTNQHFVTVLALLVELQTEKDTPYDSSILALKWSQDIVDALQTSQHMYKSKELQDLLNSVVSCGFTENSDIAHLVCQCLTKLINHAVKMNSQFWKRCQDLCNLHLYHNNRRAQKEFQNLLNNLPIEIMATNPQHLSSEVELSKNAETTSSSTCDSVKQSRRSHMSSLPMGTFHSHNFKTVMGYLLHGLVPRKKGNMIWLEQIYQSSQRSDKEQTASREAAHNLVLDNEAFLLFWATWESAQFCILSKLRTPLGKPQDTFTTIEAGIKHFAREALALETDEADNPHNNNSCKDIQDGYVVSKRVRLLMQFMEHLEKQLYNAYEGCAVSVVNPPKMVRTFFRTNRTTCQEWLGRIRQNLITVAHHCGDVSLVVRHTFEILQDLNDNNKMQSPEFKLNLVHCVEALITLRCPETIQGLYSWCKEVLGRKITWIKAASELASGKYELCIQDFKTSLSHYLCSESLPEEAKETDSNHDSEASTPSGSPKHLTEGIQKLSLLSRQSDNQLAVNSSKSGNSDSLEPCVVNFIVSQVSQSYEKICRWDDVLQWQEALKGYRSEYSDSPLKNAFAFHPDIKFIEALNHFEELDYEGARESLELVPGTSLQELDQDMKPSLPWSPNNIVNFSMKQHLRVVTATMLGYMNEEGESLLQCLEVTRKWCENIQKVSALDWPAQSQQGANIQQFISNLLKAFLNHYYGDPPGNKTFLRMYDDIKLDLQQHELDAVLKVLQSVNTVKHLQESLMYEQDALIDANTLLGQLHVSTVNLARKQQNYGLAEQLLVKEIANSIGIKSEELSMSESQDPLHEHLLKLQGTRENLNQIHCLKLERESVKLLRNKIANHVAIEAIVSSTLHHCKTIATLNPHQNRDLVAVCSDLNARSVLTLVQWLQSDPKYITQITNNLKLVGQDEELVVRKVVKDVASLLDIEKNWLTEMKSTTPSTLDEEEQYLSISDNPILADSDVVLGQLYHLATLQSPKLAKAWFALAGWCYKWGRKAVDHATHGSVELSTDEKAEVLDLLPKGISNEETESALSILSQIHTDSSSEEDISDQDQTLYDDGTETTRKQLLASCISLQIISDDKMDALIDFWKRVVQRVYHYYQLSAKAYFTYLKLNGQSFNVETNIDGNITATLRVLRLLVKHAWELRGVLEDGLAHTPTGPWKGIIPQLFSRLNHPEPYVRQSVSDLLCRVAQDSPHLIVYPAVVGCSSAKVKDADRDGLLNEYLSQNEDEEGIDAEESPEAEDDEAPEDENADILRNCFTTIVDTLARTNPGMIVEVQLLVNELRRVTLLWDELWLGTLNQHHADVNRRLQQLENEIKKVNNNNSLTKEEKAAIIKEKHKTIIKPTLFTMERLHEITSQPAETPHEKWFQENYGQLIQDGLERLRDPPKPTNPSFTWQQFKQLHHSLQQRAQRRTSLLLTMDEISPKLSTLKSTVIAMPGVSTSGEVVTIAGIHPTVQILPTKTKPKKLVFIGSDGKKHPYLFKGLEDLHLDERIMQFLAIVNNMFAKANRNHGRLYHARHYSVTPLGARSGLIQWVDGATPLFSLYKRWQQREAQAQQIKDQNAGQTTAVQPTIPRPSEVFYSKLNPALKEKGILNTDNRKDWPLNVLKNVLEDLVSETPKDLLAKELWCSSTSAREWWQITQTYSRSTAVMSMIGYIIGLGDRHLDNVLVDLVTGEVVHIDYNVCFEKGKSLRVPEKVPFRMTPNLVTALGVVGVEGIFRSTCEYVIRTMRKGRETLLTLLEAFVYDPLVDWTTGNEGGYTGAFYGGGHTANSSVARQPSKRDMEREITHSMFAIRMAEMKSSWAQNKENMLLSLANLKESYQAHLQELKALNETDLQLDELCAQQLYLENALHEEDHAIHTLSERFDEYSVVLSTKEGALEAVQEKLGECVQWQHAHQYMIKAIKEDKLQAMCTEISQPHGLSLACFNLVTDFLNSAGQGPLVLQCETTSAELISAVHQRQVIVRSCLDVLHTYATIISNYPERFLEDSRTSRCLKWLQELEQTMTIDKCKEIESDFEQQFGTVHFTAAQMQAVLTRESSIQKIYVDVNDKLVALVQRRSQETADTSILTGQVQDTATSVHSFMQENGYEGTVCMTSVVVTALSSLSKRYLIMEGAAAGAGERLMDLTSREGDWFLDELCSMSGNVSQLLGLLNDPAVTQILSTEICLQISQAVQSVHKLYASLQDLNVNFRNIILPETLKTLQLKEPSVLATIERLNKIVDDSGKTLDEWMDQLESQLRDAVMGMFSGDDNTLTAIDKMKSDFDDLLSINSSFDMSRDLTQGQMLLMGFNGLFTQLNSDFHSMQEAVAKIHTPDLWKKIDVVKEAKSIQFTAFNEHTIGLLTNLVFVKQLEAMTSFFKLAQEVAIGLQDFNSGTIRDGESLAGPIKLFIAEYVRKNLIGLPSQTLGYVLCHYMTALCIDVTAEIELRDIGATSKVSLEDLSKKAVDTNISNKVFGPLMLSQAGTIVASNDVAWRKSDLALRLDKNIHLLEQSRQRAQLQLARFQWLHEDCLTQAGRTVNQLAVPVRVTVIGELQKGIQALRHQDSVVKSKQEVHVQLEASVNQRLKWAAGANPSLNQILHQFDEHLTNKNDLIQRESRLTEDIVTIGNAILHLEALRSDMPEALAADTAFSTLLSRCEEAAALQVACKVSVSDQERSILQSYPVEPGQDLDETWINAKITDIQVQTNLHQENQEQKMNLVEASKDRIQGTVNEIRNVLTMHHKLMSDIRTILKSMAKQEEQDYGNDIKAGGIREYVNNYKMFSENFTMMMKSVITEDLTDNQGKDIEESISSLEAHTAKIYDALMTFVPPLTCEPSPEVAPTFASTVKNSEAMVAASPKKVPLSVVTKADLLSSHSPQATGSALPMKIEGPSKKADKVPRDPRTGKALQERNSYAVGVWRRVKTKLDGRDPDLSKRLSVAEQVDYVIKEATSPENLAVLYEGWTPWV